MKNTQKTKKTKEINAEKYDENKELDVQMKIKDDYYEDEATLGTEESENIEEKEFEVVEEQAEEEYEDAKMTFSRINSDKFMKIFNVIFIILIISMIIIGIDVICVARYNVGPFFAIKTNTYKDGGSKVYYGLGYKVIKYNVIEGRRDTQIGFWNMPYQTAPIFIEDVDLAIGFQNNPEETSQKYYKQYLQIESTIKEIDEQKNKITLAYTDPDGKYTLQVNCQMASNKEQLLNYTDQQKILIRGTVYKFSLRDDQKPNTVYLSDCLASEIVEETK